ADDINLTFDGTTDAPFDMDDTSGQGQDQPKVGLNDDGVVLVVFRITSADETTVRIGYVRSTDGGATFGLIQVLPSGVNVDDLPALYLDGDDAQVFACDVNNQLLQWRSGDAGATFGAAEVIHAGAERCAKAAVDGNGDDLHVAFLEEVAGEPDVFHISSQNGGDDWSDARNLTANQGQGEFPSIAVDTEDADDVHITWQDVSDFLFSMKYGGSVPEADGEDDHFANEDVVRYHGATYERVFDGSDVGLRNYRLDALALIDPAVEGGLPRYVLSFTEDADIDGIPDEVDDSDLVLFTPTSLGDDTAGTFELYFDASEIGLTRSGEDVYTVEIDGADLYLSTYGNFELSEAYGELSGKNEDIFVCRDFTATTCPGGAELIFDGSERGLTDTKEAIDAFSFAVDGNAPDSKAFFSTKGDFETATAEGEEGDLFSCRFPEFDGDFPLTTRNGSLATCNDGGADSTFRTVYVGEVNNMDEDLMAVEFQFKN
ncbi:MAG: hypothetical protein ACRDY7_10580, partial [Acidimicrobiia bacterium]